jgi:hypothetical protein
MKPNECKWCGCSDTITNRSDSVTFACRTYWDAHNGGIWVQRDDTCGSHVGDLYRRIRKALERLKSAQRYDVEPYEDSVSHNYHYEGQQVDADCVDQVIRILEGVDNDETK